jgi:hypothetical protein
MPYDSRLAERLEKVLKGRRGFEQKKMFGGIGCSTETCVSESIKIGL